ncbi:hypothetical protein Tco_0668876, partial [Tanacetum coccineum]
MSSMVELGKPCDYKVTIQSKLHTISFIEERLDLNESIDSNLVFDIVGHMLLFRRRVFLDKAKKLENKASLGKVTQGKAVKGKAAKGKAVKVNLQKVKLQKEEFYMKNVNLIENHRDTHINFKKENLSKLPTYSIYRFAWAFKILESFLNSYHWWSKVSEVIPKCLTWTRRKDRVKDSHEVMKDVDRSSARAQVEETKLPRKIALEKKVDLLTSKYVKLEPRYVNLAVCVEIAKNNFPGLSFPTPNAKAMSAPDKNEGSFPTTNDNAKAMSVRDDVGVLDVVTDDNAKATSVRDDVGVPDAAPDDNAKATSVCNDIDEADAAVDDNVKKPKAKGIKETQSSQVPISDVYNTPTDNGDIFIKDAHNIINHANPPIH